MVGGRITTPTLPDHPTSPTAPVTASSGSSNERRSNGLSTGLDRTFSVGSTGTTIARTAGVTAANRIHHRQSRVGGDPVGVSSRTNPGTRTPRQRSAGSTAP